MRLAVFAAAWGLLASDVAAHQVSESYLIVDVAADALSVQCEVALRDAQYVLDASRPSPGASAPISAAALPPILPDRPVPSGAAIARYAIERLRVLADGQPIALEVEATSTEERRGLPYAILGLRAPLKSAPSHVIIDYGLFFEDDPKHHAVLYLNAGGREQTSILDLPRRRQSFELARPRRLRALLTFAGEGVHHIWAGYDHLLFLLVLLLPAVLRRESGRLQAATDLRAAFLEVVKVVTAFTVAHSITLSLAALRLVRPPTVLVEVLIAVSVLIAALNNLRPWLGGREWMMAFGFGLIHGFGFAGVLAELGLPAGALVVALAGFNVGVEAGQLAIVAVFVPLAFAARGTWIYRNVAFRFGSLAAAGIAAVWTVERALA